MGWNRRVVVLPGISTVNSMDVPSFIATGGKKKQNSCDSSSSSFCFRWITAIFLRFHWSIFVSPRFFFSSTPEFERIFCVVTWSIPTDPVNHFCCALWRDSCARGSFNYTICWPSMKPLLMTAFQMTDFNTASCFLGIKIPEMDHTFYLSQEAYTTQHPLQPWFHMPLKPLANCFHLDHWWLFVGFEPQASERDFVGHVAELGPISLVVTITLVIAITGSFVAFFKQALDCLLQFHGLTFVRSLSLLLFLHNLVVMQFLQRFWLPWRVRFLWSINCKSKRRSFLRIRRFTARSHDIWVGSNVNQLTNTVR